jgi:hypothetical protein
VALGEPSRPRTAPLEDTPEPMPDCDLSGQPEPDVELDQRVAREKDVKVKLVPHLLRTPGFEDADFRFETLADPGRIDATIAGLRTAIIPGSTCDLRTEWAA